MGGVVSRWKSDGPAPFLYSLLSAAALLPKHPLDCWQPLQQDPEYACMTAGARCTRWPLTSLTSGLAHAQLCAWLYLHTICPCLAADKMQA